MTPGDLYYLSANKSNYAVKPQVLPGAKETTVPMDMLTFVSTRIEPRGVGLRKELLERHQLRVLQEISCRGLPLPALVMVLFPDLPQLQFSTSGSATCLLCNNTCRLYLSFQDRLCLRRS